MASVTQVTASVTIGFGTASTASPSFSAEVDSREDGYNSGKSQFAPGDTVYILLYKSTDITLGPSPVATSGGVAQTATITIDVTEDVSLAYETEFSISKPIANGTTPVFTWYSAVPAGLTKTSETTYSVAAKSIAVGKIDYKATAQVWALTGVDVSYPAAVVVFFGTAPKV